MLRRWSARALPGLLAALGLLSLPGLGVAPAWAQGRDADGWNPMFADVREPDRQVVLTFTKSEAGRVTYWTSDGSCTGAMPGVTNVTPTTSCRRTATAPEDYGAVRGDLIFTEPGARSITVTIVDDGLDEGFDEYFLLNASEGDDVAGQTRWYAAQIRIVDDDGSAPIAVVATTRSTDPPVPAGPAGAGLGGGSDAPTPPAPAPRRPPDVAPPTATAPSVTTRPEEASASGRLEPWSELTSGRAPRPQATAGPPRRSGPSPLVPLVLMAVLGGLAWRGRSPNRPAPFRHRSRAGDRTEPAGNGEVLEAYFGGTSVPARSPK
ncbi:MAG TPA: hypothetical protein VM933_04075 [Acidimicrobiales bacterium]|nr:hypothetical protein [Acidimicrobiales bacterium]